MCRPVRPAHLALPMAGGAPSQARAFLRGTLCPELALDARDEAVLLVSELVTNAVRHGGPPIVVELACAGPRGLGVRVSDGSPQLPALRHGDLSEESGRGLALVDLVSDGWGIEPGTSGKTVWFVLGDPAHRSLAREALPVPDTVSLSSARQHGER